MTQKRKIGRIRIGTKIQASSRDRIKVPSKGQSSNSIPQCPKCKKNHSGDYHFGKNICYRCGELGYYVLQCQAKPTKVNDQANKVKARVFAMTYEEVSMPSWRTIETDKLARAVQIDFDGLGLSVDLHAISMRDFDIILGMDWLGSNRATIVCFEKEVIF
ncbi:reverse transcriptase [Abeliophyllum distichum]|uniref:Reverse transcriptase n=1 Tax=Abeliophyllum distichum TaxID=126358 RepID=A0ABD1PRS1_9LAMI